MTALVGPSGAGKTTITSLVGRIYDTVEGEVLVGGHDVRDVTLDSLHEVVGVVTQDAHMFHETIRTNLLYARPQATEAELFDALRAAQIWDLVASLPDGLDTTSATAATGSPAARSSGSPWPGCCSRHRTSSCWTRPPRTWTPSPRWQVQRALKIALEGRTSLVIAHRLSTVRDADQILVVSDGQVVERGRHTQLLAAGGLYAELYETQFASQETPSSTPVEVA
jgi:ATP-binding cassette subfamily B protein